MFDFQMDTAALMRAIFVGCLVFLFVVSVTHAQDMAGPPKRPEVFRNPQELRDYLKSLNEYFAIVGRPR